MLLHVDCCEIKAALAKTPLDYNYVHNLFSEMSLNKRLKCIYLKLQAEKKHKKEAEELAKRMRENSQGILHCIGKQFVDNGE